MLCTKCLQMAEITPGYTIRQVPGTGRAHDNGLCCKHDRIINGPMTAEEKGNKQREQRKRKQASRA
jgi:hypothetical protein